MEIVFVICKMRSSVVYVHGVAPQLCVPMMCGVRPTLATLAPVQSLGVGPGDGFKATLVPRAVMLPRTPQRCPPSSQYSGEVTRGTFSRAFVPPRPMQRQVPAVSGVSHTSCNPTGSRAPAPTAAPPGARSQRRVHKRCSTRPSAAGPSSNCSPSPRPAARRTCETP